MSSDSFCNIVDPTVENVLLVECIKHTLLSISQLCDKDNKVMFDSSMSRVVKIHIILIIINYLQMMYAF